MGAKNIKLGSCGKHPAHCWDLNVDQLYVTDWKIHLSFIHQAKNKTSITFFHRMSLVTGFFYIVGEVQDKMEVVCCTL